MKELVLAPAFCQVAWVVRDIAAAERFFLETMGVSRFLHMDNLAAKDTQGTYLGKPGNWVCHLYIAYAGDTQVELIQPVSGASMFQESLEQHGDAVQHVAYWLDDSDYDAAAAHLTSSGYPEIQSFRLPVARVGYFDTRRAIGVVTEIVGASKEGHEFRRNLKAGNF
jgi:methylmalonyl-CoA/ethylmalonyl-CoA epimerase